MKDTKELRQKRASLVNDGRAILDKAEAEKRELTQEEKNQYDQIMDQVIKLGEDIALKGLKEYLKRRNRDLNKLMKFAQVCRVKGIISQYVKAIVG